MKSLVAFLLAIAFVPACFAGDTGGLLGRRAARRAARAECASCNTVTAVKETPAVIKTESVYKKVGEKVTIVPADAASKKSK